MRGMRSGWLAGLALAIGACASAPPKPPAAPSVTTDQKMTWILQLEDQRILRVPPPAPEPAPVPVRKGARALPPPAPVVTPDLTTLLADTDPRIRRRAALAVGRTGLIAGAAPLQPLLTDADPDVRQMAAFALGLLADKSATAALTTALQDTDPRVRGRAAEALGLIGDAAAAPAIGQMAAAYIHAGALASLAPDEEAFPGTPESMAVRLGLFALVRLKTWDPLASAVLDASGRPAAAWWPVSYALQRINDRRALPALQQLATGRGTYSVAFAVRGLGGLKDPSSVPALVALIDRAKGQVPLTVTAVRALAQIGGPDAAAGVLKVLRSPQLDPNIRLEAVTAAGALKAADALPFVQDWLTDQWPTLRAAALRAVAAIDPEGFPLTLSGMDPDPHWIVRAALADVLGTMPAEVATQRLKALLTDQDRRVVPAALGSLVKLKVPDAETLLLTALKDPDFAIRAAAAEGLGEVKPVSAPNALREAYRLAGGDATYTARAAILTALTNYGAAEATETLRTALTDKDWALRIRAAELLAKLDPSAGDLAAQIRPAPGPPILPYQSPELSAPSYSPHAFIETALGTIEIELAVLDAPQTSQSFIALARKGFFNGLQIHRVVPNFVVQDGDPRGDGSGAPGYTIRDELNDQPYVRGTVGMALEWRDTGGSQFFITHSPQPHLDAKYPVFGHVVNGMDVVDKLKQLDTIQRIRIWDGKEMK